MTPDLKRYLKRWLKWAEAGGNDGEIYSKYYGLCANAALYDWYDSNSYKSAASELKELLFKEFGPNYTYPFGGDDYDIRSYDGTQHLCPIRLAWVRNKLGIQ